MSSRIFRHIATGLSLVVLAACARPVGDFNRAAPSYTHDVLMPSIGDQLAKSRGEPVSDFVTTDQEREMQDRVWRYLVAQHTKDWFYDTAVEFKRTRIAERMQPFPTDRYYGWLKQTHYQSSPVRYSRLSRDITYDIELMPDTFRAICAVIEIDRRRQVSMSEIGSLEDSVLLNADARFYENDDYIAWFVHAARYRYDSYSYALDHLLIESPHEAAQGVDRRLADLGVYVQRAERHDFCGDANLILNPGQDGIIPSRYSRPQVNYEDTLPPK